MNPEPRLLLIDEDQEDRALAAVVLSAALPGIRIEQLGEGTPDLSTALGVGVFDLVVTDLDTRSARGELLVRLIRARQPRAAILVFTRTDDRDSAVAAMKAGAADYLIKSSAGFLRLATSAAEALGELRAARGVERPQERRDVDSTPVPETVTSSGSAAATSRFEEILLETQPEPALQLEPEMEVEPEPVAQPEVEPEPQSEAEAGPQLGAEPLSASAARVAPAALRIAVDRARRSVAAVQSRSLGAVLGIVAILALFSLLAASFFGGDSESVEAQSVEVQAVESEPVAARAVETQPVEVQKAPSLAADREVELDPSLERAPEGSKVDSSSAADTPAANGAEAGVGPGADERRATASSEKAMPVVVRLEATAEVWVQGTTDGRPPLDRVLASGEVLELRGLETTTLLIGNAAGLRILWNGQDLGALGDQGQVRRLYFTPDRVGVGPLPPG